MLPNIFYQFKESKRHTDLTIKIISPQITTDIYVHRVILCAMCSYFDRLLSSQMKETKTNIIEMHVNNGYVFMDFINRLYGENTNVGNISDAKHLLETIILQDYLSIKPLDLAYHEYQLLSEVSEEDHDLLLQVAGILDNETINSFAKIKLDVDIGKTRYYISYNNSGFEIFIKADDIYFSYNKIGVDGRTFLRHIDHNAFIYYSRDGYFSVYDFYGKNNWKINVWSDKSDVVAVSSDLKYLAIASKELTIYNIQDSTIHQKIECNDIQQMLYSPDNKYLLVKLKYKLLLFDATNYIIVQEAEIEDCENIKFSPDSQKIIYTDNFLGIINIEQINKVTNKVNIPGKAPCICLLDDYIIIPIRGAIIVYDYSLCYVRALGTNSVDFFEYSSISILSIGEKAKFIIRTDHRHYLYHIDSGELKNIMIPDDRFGLMIV